jgi:hypothetical protein
MSAIRFSGLFLVVLLVVAIGADEPSQQPPAGSTRPSADNPNSRATDQIQKALRGKSVETGDGILDDMLEVLQQRGSILDGSSLDEGLNELTPAVDSSHSGNATSQTTDANNARVAESLLKSARLLEKLGKLNGNQRSLVAQMRRVAVDLLTADAKAVAR